MWVCYPVSVVMAMWTGHRNAPTDVALFCTMYKAWCPAAVGTVALCFLAEQYEHACHIIHRIADLEVSCPAVRLNTHKPWYCRGHVGTCPHVSRVQCRICSLPHRECAVARRIQHAAMACRMNIPAHAVTKRFGRTRGR